MFIRTERSVKEFMTYYPVVSWLVIIHLALWLIIDLLRLPFGIELFRWGAGLNIAIHHGEYWRLFTSMILHGGLMHTLFNSFSLVLFGPALEQMLGKFKFITVYIWAGFVGNLATYLIDPTASYLHIGASGAIYGLFGIYVFMVLFRKHLIDPGSAQIITVISIIGGLMTFMRPGINIYAHVFGFLGGFAVAAVILHNVRPYSPWIRRQVRHDDSLQFDPDRWQKKRIPKRIKMRIFWIFLGILVVLGLIGRLQL